MQEVVRGPGGQGNLDFPKLVPRAHLTPLGFLMRNIPEVSLIFVLTINFSGKDEIGLTYKCLPSSPAHL